MLACRLAVYNVFIASMLYHLSPLHLILSVPRPAHIKSASKQKHEYVYSTILGEIGHEMVAELAYENIEPLHAMLKSQHNIESVEDFKTLALWADNVKNDPDWSWSAPLHYVNIHGANCKYSAKADCADGCVVSAIANYTSQWQADDSDDIALKFLVHLGGDLFQPYHAGQPGDRGGNTIYVTFFGAKMNVHAVWDKGFIERYVNENSYEQLLNEIREETNYDSVGTLTEEVNHSANIVCNDLRTDDLEDNFDNYLEIIRQQIKRASIFVANVLLSSRGRSAIML